MKCPHCNSTISLLSSEIRSFRRDRVCPYCYQPIRLSIDYKMGLKIFIPAIIAVILLDPFLHKYGLSGAFIVGMIAGMAAMITLTIKPQKYIRRM